jgi:hypothetical protein
MASHELFAWSGLEPHPPNLSLPNTRITGMSHQHPAISWFLRERERVRESERARERVGRERERETGAKEGEGGQGRDMR